MLSCCGCDCGCLVAVDAVDSDEGVVWGEACHIVGYFFLCFAGAVCVVGGVGDAELAVGFVGFVGVRVGMWMWVMVVVLWMLLMVMVVIMVVIMVVVVVRMMRRWWRRRRRVILIRHRCRYCYFSSSRDCDCDYWSFILALYLLVIGCWQLISDIHPIPSNTHSVGDLTMRRCSYFKCKQKCSSKNMQKGPHGWLGASIQNCW